MERIPGLADYVRQPSYRQALGLPERVTETYTFLAQGEYNVNYRFTHPVTGQALLLRVNCGSQMHLPRQIDYEYQALRLLERTGRTPRALYADGSLTHLDRGVLVMEFLPGRALDYPTETLRAAALLADVHSAETTAAETDFLVHPAAPLNAILSECREMASHYFDSPLADADKCRRIEAMLRQGEAMAAETGAPVQRCINTELNSTNFLMNPAGRDYLVDWEKPILGDPAQDLGHFLAPTTTFWKTDVILDEEDEKAFLRRYLDAVDGRFDTAGLEERVAAFIPVTCLRGITWCAMAWVEYQQPRRALRNESTARKLEQYLDTAFLERIRRRYLN